MLTTETLIGYSTDGGAKLVCLVGEDQHGEFQDLEAPKTIVF